MFEPRSMTLRLWSSALCAALGAIGVSAAPTAPEVRTFPAVTLRAGAVSFPVRGIHPPAIRAGRVRVGPFRSGIATSRLRAAARTGILRVRVPRRYRRPELAARVRRAVRRGGARLLVWLEPARGQPDRLAGFEGKAFTEVDGRSESGGVLATTSERSYDGSRSMRATTDGTTGNQFQRLWYRVNWQTGADVWYGLALYVPDHSQWCWWRPARWDNHALYGGAGDIGGLRIEAGALYLDVGRYGEDATQLIGPVPLAERRWIWVEVHQRLSARPGHALSEVWVDGRRVGASRKGNSFGRPVTDVRFGNVTLASECSRAGSIWFDRVSISGSQRPPVH
jgi:hypothetical protein